jgi:hypothetical protein
MHRNQKAGKRTILVVVDEVDGVLQVIVVGVEVAVVVEDEDSRSVFYVCAVFVAVKPTFRCLYLREILGLDC